MASNDYVFLIVFSTIFYVVFTVIINKIFIDRLNFCFVIKFPLPKKYEGRLSPIYKISKFWLDDESINIAKWELQSIHDWYIINYILPIPIKIFKYKYIVTHNHTIFLADSTIYSYEDYVKLCEDDIIEENRKKLIKEKTKLHDKKLNEVFDKNYFD